MITRVVVLLSAPAGFINTFFPTEEQARVFIRQWKERQGERIKNGQFQDMETTLYDNSKPNEPESISWAVMGQYIIGMYIPDSAPTAQERAAAAVEKLAGQATEGDEWKGK